MLDLWERNAVPFLSDAGFELLNSPGSLLYLGFLGAPNISMCVVQHCLTKICRAFPKKKQKNIWVGADVALKPLHTFLD